MIDVAALAAFLAFVAVGLSVIPLDAWLERRRARRRHQAHPERGKS